MKNAKSVDDKSIYYRFGKDVFGPFLYGFTSWLIEKIKEVNPNKILFLARDGYMMKKAYEVLTDEAERLPYAYFYCSRKSLRNALLWKLDTYEESLKYVNVQKRISVGYMLEYYGFTEKEKRKILTNMNISDEYSVSYEGLTRCEVYKAIFETNKDVIKKRSIEQDELLLKYVEQIGIGRKTLIVDIGWHGSMQYYMEEFVRYHSIATEIVGTYVGIYSFCDLKGRTYGYLFESGDNPNRKKTMCSHGIMEKLFQSLEGSTYKYDLVDGKIVPLNQKYEYIDDELVVQCIDEWQKAAIGCLLTLKNEPAAIEYKEYAKKLLRFGMHPSIKDVDVFKFLYNYDGEKYYYTSNKRLREYSLKELKNNLLKSPWKTGFMKSVLKVPFPYYWIYKLVS